MRKIEAIILKNLRRSGLYAILNFKEVEDFLKEGKLPFYRDEIENINRFGKVIVINGGRIKPFEDCVKEISDGE